MAETDSSSIEQRAATVEEEARIMAEAERKGRARGGRLRAAETAMRNTLIVQRRVEQWEWSMIAEEAGITVRQCQRVWDNYRSMPSPLDIPPADLVEELARGYRLTVGQFTALAATADNTAAAVGALKGANDAREKMLAVLQAVGHVPHDLGTLKLQRDVQQVALKMLDTIERFERGEITSQEAADVFRDLAGIRTEELAAGGFTGD